VYDNSDDQLRRDADLSERFDLGIATVRGNMQDLGELHDRAFDLIVHPVSNCFVDDVRPVWRECGRVLTDGGSLLSGFCNPFSFAIDWDEADATGRCVVKHSIPYSDLEALSGEEKERYRRERIPFEFGHTLADLIQGQIDAGFTIAGFYEDKGDEALDRYVDRFLATRAVRMPGGADERNSGT
jgi:SAM-dependent methyltransferase